LDLVAMQKLIGDEVRRAVGGGRPAAEIAGVVQDVYDGLAGLHADGAIPSDDGFRWRIADQMVRALVQVTRDGRLLLAEPWGEQPAGHEEPSSP
jgi:hypothetical protein